MFTCFVFHKRNLPDSSYVDEAIYETEGFDVGFTIELSIYTITAYHSLCLHCPSRTQTSYSSCLKS